MLFVALLFDGLESQSMSIKERASFIKIQLEESMSRNLSVLNASLKHVRLLESLFRKEGIRTMVSWDALRAKQLRIKSSPSYLITVSGISLRIAGPFNLIPFSMRAFQTAT